MNLVDSPQDRAQEGPRDFSMKLVISKATEVAVLSAALYRELALSALTLLPTRDSSDPDAS